MTHLNQQFHNLSWHDQELTRSIIGAVNYRTVTEQRSRRIVFAIVGTVAVILCIVLGITLHRTMTQSGAWHYVGLLVSRDGLANTKIILYALLESLPFGLVVLTLSAGAIAVWAAQKAIYHHYQFIRNSSHL